MLLDLDKPGQNKLLLPDHPDVIFCSHCWSYCCRPHQMMCNYTFASGEGWMASRTSQMEAHFLPAAAQAEFVCVSSSRGQESSWTAQSHRSPPSYNVLPGWRIRGWSESKLWKPPSDSLDLSLFVLKFASWMKDMLNCSPTAERVERGLEGYIWRERQEVVISDVYSSE